MGIASRAVVAVCFSSVVGCVIDSSPEAATNGPLSDRVGVVQSAIQGGTTDASATYVVGLYNSVQQSRCTAVMIAPNLAIASRHCIDVTATKVTCATHFGVKIGDTDISLTSCNDISDIGKCTWHQSVKIYRPADDSFCGNDIVLIRLGEPMTDIVPATPNFLPVVADNSADFAVIGYGATDPQLDSPGVRRRIGNMTVACVGSVCSGTTAANGDQMADNEFASSSLGVCEGDSGAPAIQQRSDGTVNVLGVVSRVGYLEHTCSGSIYTRLDRWRTFIAGAARESAAAGNYTAASWTQGLMGDACATGGDCGSTTCGAFNSQSMCTHACDATTTCEAGYQCGAQSLCEPVAPAATATPATPTAPTGPVRLSDGCSIGASHSDAREDAPWSLLALAAIGLAGRRRRASAAH